MGLLSNRITREELQPGDHVYSWRTAYTYAHHGIYVGDGTVIHYTRGQGEELGTGTFIDKFLTSSRSTHVSRTPCEKCGNLQNRNAVILSCLDCFLCGGPLYRFEYAENAAIFLVKIRGGTCTLAEADPPTVVIHRARYLLGNWFGCYGIFSNNCEDFAMYCKTGLLVMQGNTIGSSGQVVSFVGAPLAAVVASPLRLLMSQSWGMVGITVVVYSLSRYLADLGVRMDVAKVAVEDLVLRLGPMPAVGF